MCFESLLNVLKKIGKIEKNSVPGGGHFLGRLSRGGGTLNYSLLRLSIKNDRVNSTLKFETMPNACYIEHNTFEQDDKEEKKILRRLIKIFFVY